MPAIIKPSRIATAIHMEPAEGGGQMTLSAFLLFDFATPRKFLTDQALWPMVVEQMPKGAIFDKGQLKPKGEMIVVGAALAPGDQPVTGIKVTARLGAIEKRLAVFGDRYWRMTDRGILMTEARPFDRMPIDDQHAFGGPDHKLNLRGKGDKARQIVDAGYEAPLPNVEDADRPIRSIDDRPLPAGFGPLPPDAAQRMRYAGTYDQHWIKNVSPSKPVDFNPLFHCDAPEDQRFDTHFNGDEAFAVSGMSRGGLHAGRLPHVRLRAFIHRSDDSLAETRMVCDTVTLFPNITKATMAFRALAKGTDSLCADIATVMIAMEHAEAPPRPADYYRHIFGLRTDRQESHKHAFSDFQLMPEVDPGIISARRAAKLEDARAKQLKFMDNLNWAARKAIEDRGLPADMVPPPDNSGVAALPLVPQPSAQEIADGDFDLAELIDDVKTMEKAVLEMRDREMAAAELQRRALIKSTPAAFLTDFLKQPIVDDAHMERFSDLALDEGFASGLAGADRVLGDNKTALEGLHPEFSGEAFAHLPDELDSIFDTLGDGGPVDAEAVEKQLATACARAMRQPEGSLLFEARQSIANTKLDSFDFSQPVDETSDVHREFADLFGNITAETPSAEAATAPAGLFPTEEIAFDRSDAEQALAKAAATIEAKFPHLVGNGGDGDAIERLMSKVREFTPAASDQEGNKTVPARLVEQKKSEALQNLDEAEEMVDEAILAGRQKTPAAIFPMQAFLPGVAERLGAFVIEKLKEGHDFRGADLAGANLRDVDFSGLDLRSTFFERADLTNARFVGANLEGAVFTEAMLRGADFSGAVMNKVNLSKAVLRDSRLDRCQLNNCTLVGTDFTGASAREMRASRITIIESVLDDADFSGVDMAEMQILKGKADGLVLDRARISRASFMVLSMRDASFEEAALERVAFMELTAPGANFAHAQMNCVGFIGKGDLSGGRFDEIVATDTSWNTADMTESCFLRARCDSCLFNDCDMSASDLRLASLKRARFDKSILADSDLFGANLYGASIGKVDLRRTSLRGANLYLADLTDTKLGSCDLTGANLGKTLLEAPSDA
ncbi:uncharacterized protein YjbI with pentapeptide repeats [Rhizobium sp. BK313]|uniref:DUF2169 family type VI secretion system accessory protein n=1 Tax=Rhizobium sp. BK313 TaxID=2587081 RepID=UPI0010600E23|nr:DUF2169 domain-containing protein [Rhizobium sp. BK313]MBB3457500.1 uncharacterized protein YjbI with pentapeptide repeats [Rhizobium sp. BK313]